MKDLFEELDLANRILVKAKEYQDIDTIEKWNTIRQNVLKKIFEVGV
jgi:hypothetical protein